MEVPGSFDPGHASDSEPKPGNEVDWTEAFVMLPFACLPQGLKSVCFILARRHVRVAMSG